MTRDPGDGLPCDHGDPVTMVTLDPITMVMVAHSDPRPDDHGDPGDMGDGENAGDRPDDPVTL